MELEQEQPTPSLFGPVVVHPISAFRPVPVFAALENTAMETEQGGVAAAPAPVIVPVSISRRLSSCLTQLSQDANWPSHSDRHLLFAPVRFLVSLR